MVVGEDKAKVLNIVKPNMAHFRELYGSILQESPQVVYKAQQGSLEVSGRWDITGPSWGRSPFKGKSRVRSMTSVVTIHRKCVLRVNVFSVCLK